MLLGASPCMCSPMSWTLILASTSPERQERSQSRLSEGQMQCRYSRVISRLLFLGRSVCLTVARHAMPHRYPCPCMMLRIAYNLNGFCFLRPSAEHSVHRHVQVCRLMLLGALVFFLLGWSAFQCCPAVSCNADWHLLAYYCF